MLEPALGLHFSVLIDGHNSLGNWTKCEGLSVEYDVHEYAEGGLNAYVHRLPGRAKYQNIRLTRPIDASSAAVIGWVASIQAIGARATAQISVRDASGLVVSAWNLLEVYPVKWTGPTLDVDTAQVATETLELAHNGFLSPV
jgi:phage tail-like protein